MDETLEMEKPVKPWTLEKFIKKGGNLASREGIQLLESYGCNAIIQIANSPSVRKQLSRAFNNARCSVSLGKKILAALAA
jgi:hypothetical protein